MMGKGGLCGGGDSDDDDDDQGGLLRGLPVNFKSYCVFCLQYLLKKDGGGRNGTYRSYVEGNPRRIKSLEPALSYLIGEEPKTKTKLTSESERVRTEVGRNEGGGRRRGRRADEGEVVLPPMCLECYEVMGELDRLNKELIKIQHLIQKQTLIARMTVLKTTMGGGGKKSSLSRRERFEERIHHHQEKSGLSGSEVQKARAVVDKLHYAMIREGTKSVKIPQVLPVHLMEVPLNDPEFLPKEHRQNATASVKIEPKAKVMEGCRSRRSSEEDPDWLNDEGTFDPMDILSEMEVDEEENDEGENGKKNTDKKSSLHPKPSSFPIEDGLTLTKASTSTTSTNSSVPVPTNSSRPSSSTKGQGRHQHKTMRRHIINGKSNTQVCDLCGKLCYLTEIVQHLESHGVKDYIRKCLNPDCRHAFSCLPRMNFHVTTMKRCRIAANIPLDKRAAQMRHCDTCGFQTDNIIVFRNHLDTHEHEIEEKKLTCPIQDCGKVFSLRQTIDLHLGTHNLRPPKAFQYCAMCSAKLRVEQVSPHLADVHGIPIPDQFPCNLCKFIYPDKESLVKHAARHGEEAWFCDMCDDAPKFTKHFYMVRHYIEKHQIGKEYLCEQCPKVFYIKQTWQDHQRKDHSTTGEKVREKKAKCDLCGEDSLSYISQVDVLAHKIKVHGFHPFICKTCGKTFTRKCFKTRHERLAHDGYKHEAAHKCDVEGCDKVCWNRTQLEDHKHAKHSGAPHQRHVCDTCGVGFNWQAALTKHKRVVHLGIRRTSICDVCGESFRSPKILSDHMLIHTGERPHPCPICSQPFRQKQALRNHLISHKRWGSNFKTTGPRHNVKRRVFKNKKE